ncbi:MAG: methyltransferase domain-containing protein [Pseudomonadota bacterium]
MTRRLVEASQGLPPNYACLDVGAGTGKVVAEWLSAGGRKPGRYRAVEPNPLHASTLQDTCQRLALDARVDQVAFNVGYTLDETFDLAVFSHCLYWIESPGQSVKHAFASLNSGGVLIAFLQGPYAIHSMYHLFETAFERDRPAGPDHGFSSAELLAELRDMGLSPSVHFDPTPHDLTGLFDADNESVMNEYLSFCLQIEFAQLAGQLRDDIIAYLRAACTEQSGRLLWLAPNATVSLHKD